MRRFIFLAAGLFFVSLCKLAFAESPYALRQSAGEWMILIQSYTSDVRHGGISGELQAELADDFAAVLRRDYKLPAYVFNRGEEARRVERARVEAERKKAEEEIKVNPRLKGAKPAPIRSVKIEDSYAVLVGGWKDMDTARKALESI